MKKSIKDAIESYQCPGCVLGSSIACFGAGTWGIGCDKHVAGTTIWPGVGRIFLGMPKGFNRLGDNENTTIRIFEKYEDNTMDKFNVAVWKYLNEAGHTIVRVLAPRVNKSTVIVFLENCMDRIECFEVTNEMMDEID